MTIDLALLISVLSVAFGIWFGLTNKNKQDKGQIEQDVKEKTLIGTKLDKLLGDVQDVKYNTDQLSKNYHCLSEKIVAIDESTKSAHKRIDSLEKRVFFTEESGEKCELKTTKEK